METSLSPTQFLEFSAPLQRRLAERRLTFQQFILLCAIHEGQGTPDELADLLGTSYLAVYATLRNSLVSKKIVHQNRSVHPFRYELTEKGREMLKSVLEL